MSTILNLLCPICTEMFHNDDNIHCTNCGHLVHYKCMQGWLDRSTCCPQCRSPNPLTHKIYLSFDESATTTANISELNLLVNRLKDVIVLKDKEIQNLRNKQVELNNEHANSMQLQEAECKTLKEIIGHLKEQNVMQSNEIERLSKELETLKSFSETTIYELRRGINNAQINKENEIKTLKNDLDNTSIVLAKEISNNAQLSVDYVNLKYEKEIRKQGRDYIELNNEYVHGTSMMIQHLEPEVLKESVTYLEEQNVIQSYEIQRLLKELEILKSPSDGTIIESRSEINNAPFMTTTSMNTTLASSSIQSTINLRNGRRRDFFDSSNRIVIRNYPLVNLQYPLENIILFIGNNMGIEITRDAIDKVNILKSNSEKSLFVRFRSKELKEKFLLYKSSLLVSSFPYLNVVEINEYFDDRAQKLFAYAHRKLRGNGYEAIFLSNNQVFATKRTVMSDSKEILRILSFQQVDEALLQNKCDVQKDISLDP